MSERYAPDLALSIRLWEDLYINNPRSDSHSNKANNWIKTNTGYSGTDKDPSTSRIREIASPFKEWGAKRDKNHKK
ncbi:hypothetical protein ACMUMS_16365 [Acinetobacter courvalinii]|uniref:hypothetical protein n=1 Tax=Acinetobacter courvalinii TaxID=280147 RepID=UPI003A86F078